MQIAQIRTIFLQSINFTLFAFISFFVEAAAAKAEKDGLSKSKDSKELDFQPAPRVSDDDTPKPPLGTDQHQLPHYPTLNKSKRCHAQVQFSTSFDDFGVVGKP